MDGSPELDFRTNPSGLWRSPAWRISAARLFHASSRPCFSQCQWDLQQEVKPTTLTSIHNNYAFVLMYQALIRY
jgi:hypothetical protein